MTKEEQFLLLAQSAFVVSAIDRAPTATHNQAPLVIDRMAEALAAVSRIPAGMPVDEAAKQFCAWKIDDAEKPGWL
jgi:hypothetical protein